MNRHNEVRYDAIKLAARVDKLITRGQTTEGQVGMEHFNEVVDATLFPVKDVVSIEQHAEVEQQFEANMEGLKEILEGLKRLITGKPEKTKADLKSKMDEFRKHIHDKEFIERMSLKFGELESKDSWANLLTIDGKPVPNLGETLKHEVDFFFKEIVESFSAADTYVKWSIPEIEDREKEPPMPSAKLSEPQFRLLGTARKTRLLERNAQTDAPYYQFSDPEHDVVKLPYPDKEEFVKLVEVQLHIHEKYTALVNKYYNDIKHKYNGEEHIWNVFGYFEDVFYRISDLEHALVSYLMASINKEKEKGE